MNNVPEKKKVESDNKSLFFGDSGSYTKIINRLFSQGRHLTPQAKWLYATLQSFWNEKTERIFPSYKSIEKRSGLTRPAISKALKELEYFRWVIKRKHFSKSTDYELVYPKLINEKSGMSEDQTYPTKEQAVHWKKAEAKNRLDSRKKSRRKKIWETNKYDGEGKIIDEDIPF